MVEVVVMMMEIRFPMFVVCTICAFLHTTSAVSHETTLLWTQKNFDGSVKITGIPGEPETWMGDNSVTFIGTSKPLNQLHSLQSHRVALSFRYATQEVFFSDVGFKEIFKVRLRVMPKGTYSYNTTVERVFSGTSVQVYGMAIDWLSGSVYWTDARYNWITVASASRYEIYRHIVTTGLDRPMGIAVFPSKGLLFWSDWGAVPKIEKANLLGKERQVIISKKLGRPLGMTIDYHSEHLYWVDDTMDYIERSDLDGSNREAFSIEYENGNTHLLFGIAVYRDFIFVTDRYTMAVLAYNKTDHKFLRRFGVTAIPYDIIMYDGSLQEDVENNDCATLGCDDMCISKGGGRGECMCKQSAQLQPDGISCKERSLSYKPRYIYTVGNSVCRTPINIPDLRGGQLAPEVDCFIHDVGEVQAIAFDAYADLLFYSDARYGTIHRKQMNENGRTDIIAMQTGNVKGMAVDWLAGNIYWTDEEFGKIIVAKTDGSYKSTLLSGIHLPRGIAVNPHTGLMYWSARGAIYVSQMDGSNIEVFIKGDSNFSPDGIVIDIRKQRLHWVDGNRVESAWLNGTNRVVDVTADENIFRDVTVYQDYIAWTDGSNGVYFGYHNPKNYKYRHINHPESAVSHDIITFSTYLQPLSQGGCDVSDAGCGQLCLPTKKNATCACAIGFVLGSDGKTCTSSLQSSNIVLFIDPYHREVYQVGISSANREVQGVGIRYADFPSKFDYDPISGQLYWFDESDQAMVIKGTPLLHAEIGEIIVTLSTGTSFGNMVVDGNSSQLFYTDSDTINVVSLNGISANKKYQSNNLISSCLAMDSQQGRIYWVEQDKDDAKTYHVISSYVHDVNIFSESSRKSVTTNDVIKGITVDVNEPGNLYWWTGNSISHWDTTTDTVQVIESAKNHNYTSVAVIGDVIYYSAWKRRYLSKLSLDSGHHVTVTSSIFSSLTDVRSYKGGYQTPAISTPTKTNSDGSHPRSHARMTSTSSLDKRDVTILAASVSSAFVILIVLLIIVIVLCRKRRKHTQPPPPALPHVSAAHDNPVYMSTAEIQNARAAAAAATSPPPSSPLPPPPRPAADDVTIAFAPPLETKMALPDDEEFGAVAAVEEIGVSLAEHDEKIAHNEEIAYDDVAVPVDDFSDDKAELVTQEPDDDDKATSPSVTSLKSMFENVSYRPSGNSS